jgi:hypothetical protein
MDRIGRVVVGESSAGFQRVGSYFRILDQGNSKDLFPHGPGYGCVVGRRYR